MPHSEEVSTLEVLVGVLEPLSVLTDALSGEENATGLAVRPILKHVMDTCKADDKDEPQMNQPLLEILLIAMIPQWCQHFLTNAAFWIPDSRRITSWEIRISLQLNWNLK